MHLMAYDGRHEKLRSLKLGRAGGATGARPPVVYLSINHHRAGGARFRSCGRAGRAACVEERDGRTTVCDVSL